MVSRKEEKEQRRRERLEKERALEQQSRQRRLYTIVAGGVLSIAAVAAIVIAVAAGGGGGGAAGGTGLKVRATDPPTPKQTDLVKAASIAGCKLFNPPIEGRLHTLKPVHYKTNPPSSGNHNPIPTPDGAYGTAPVIYHLVHSLEHGRIEIQFRPSLSQKWVAELKGLFDQDSYHMILTPNPTKMPYQLAAVAWGHIAGCKRISDASFDVIRDFTTRYRDKGPEFIP